MKRSFFTCLSICALSLVFSTSIAQTWQYTGSMNETRWISAMSSFDDKAIIIGGYTSGLTPMSSCEVYDPATARWSYTGSLNVARAHAVPYKLSNGTILVFGGLIGYYGQGIETDSVESYDPATGVWTVVGAMNEARLLPTVTQINDSIILIAGGLTSSGVTSSCELYNINTHSSTTAASMEITRYEHRAVLLNNGKVLITGGRDGGAYGQFFNSCEIYDPSTNDWTTSGDMHQARMQGILAKFSDGTILTSGGRNTPVSSAPGSELFDPTTETWGYVDSMQEPVCVTGSVLLPDDRFMATGGLVDGIWTSSQGLDDISTNTCEWYDKASNQWYYAPTLNTSRDKHCAVYLHQTVNDSLPEDLILVAGGHGGSLVDSATVQNTFTNTAEVLDVTEVAMGYYIAHQPTSGVRNDGQPTSFTAQVIYNDKFVPSISLTSDMEQDLQYRIMTTDGKVVATVNCHVGEGASILHIDMTGVTKGVYLMNINSEDTKLLLKVIVNN